MEGMDWIGDMEQGDIGDRGDSDGRQSRKGYMDGSLFEKNIGRIANTVQSRSLLSGHYDCNVLMF